MDGEEDLQDCLQRNRLRIERDLAYLGVSRVARADPLVGRIGNGSPGITGLDFLDALQLLEDGFRAPEAAAAERDGFLRV